MPRPRRSRRTWVTLAVLVLISITVITLDERVGSRHLTSGVKSAANDIFSPVRGGVNAIIHPIGDFFAGMVNYGNLQSENNKLRATIGQLRQQQAENSYAQRQLGQITRLDHLTFLGNLSTQAAQVTTYDSSNFTSSVTINKGRGDGVLPGMPVVGNGGLVGLVTFAAHHSATVTMITDGSSKVGATFGPTSTIWTTVQGEGPGRSMSANYVQPSTTVQTGWTLYTNEGQGGSLPSGIPIGRITSFDRVSGASQLTIHVAPAANLSSLAYVDVVLWEPAA